MKMTKRFSNYSQNSSFTKFACANICQNSINSHTFSLVVGMSQHILFSAGTTLRSHGKMKLFKTPPVTSGAEQREELDEAAYTY
jgi:hypothetical protein